MLFTRKAVRVAKRNFDEMRDESVAQGKDVCFGLDPVVERIPQCVDFSRPEDKVFSFLRQIIDETYDIVGAYKADISFFNKLGIIGGPILGRVVRHINEIAPEVPFILDAKYTGNEDANENNAHTAFEIYRADAVTATPYMGLAPLIPFVFREGTGLFILCRNSNPGSDEFQCEDVGGDNIPGLYMQSYEYVAHRVSEFNRKHNRDCGLVMGANDTEAMASVRKANPELFYLSPGIGAQGGDIGKVTVATRGKRVWMKYISKRSLCFSKR